MYMDDEDEGQLSLREQFVRELERRLKRRERNAPEEIMEENGKDQFALLCLPV